MFIHINQRVLINKSVSVITVIFLQLRYILFYMFGKSLLHVLSKKQNKWDEDIGMTTIFKKRIYETCMKEEQDI